MHGSYVELIGLRRFGTVAAVSDVSLAIPEEGTTLLGRVAAADDALRLIAGFIQPDAGEIRIKDRRVNDIPPQRRVQWWFSGLRAVSAS
jgi:ABC-type Fe3+/spermidine/putrescine transport system ATPase subunit